MSFKKPRIPGASRPPFVRSPGPPASDFGLPTLAPLLDSGTRSSREGAPLNSYPEPSGSPTPHLGGKQTPGPGREQAATPAPLPRALPAEPGAPSPVRGCVAGAADRPARAPHLPGPAAAAARTRRSSRDAAGAGAPPGPSDFLGPRSPAPPTGGGGGRASPWSHLPPKRRRGGRWLRGRLVLGPRGAKRKRSLITHSSGLARKKRKMCPRSLAGTRGAEFKVRKEERCALQT